MKDKTDPVVAALDMLETLLFQARQRVGDDFGLTKFSVRTDFVDAAEAALAKARAVTGGTIVLEAMSQNARERLLGDLLMKARSHKMTPQEQLAQAISFVYGNCAIDNPIVDRRMVGSAAARLARGTAMRERPITIDYPVARPTRIEDATLQRLAMETAETIVRERCVVVPDDEPERIGEPDTMSTIVTDDMIWNAAYERREAERKAVVRLARAIADRHLLLDNGDAFRDRVEENYRVRDVWRLAQCFQTFSHACEDALVESQKTWASFLAIEPPLPAGVKVRISGGGQGIIEGIDETRPAAFKVLLDVPAGVEVGRSLRIVPFEQVVAVIEQADPD